MKRSLSLLLLFFVLTSSFAQPPKRKGSNFNRGKDINAFLHKQWWIAVKGGANFTNPIVEKHFSVIVPTNYGLNVVSKEYKKFTPGSQIGLEATFYFKGFSISLQPVFENVRFGYATSMVWSDLEDANAKLDVSFSHNHELQYLTTPLLLRYEYHLNEFAPYVNVGMFGSILLHANKEVTGTGTDYSSGGMTDFTYNKVTVGATDLFQKYTYGFVLGGGLFYTTGNIRLNLDIQYRHSLSLINSPENRYSNDRLSGIGDAMDDLKFQNLSVSAGVQFPLRFLSKGFKSTDKI